MEVGDGDTGGEDGIVWVLGGEVGGSLGGEVLRRVSCNLQAGALAYIQLDGGLYWVSTVHKQ